MLASQNDHVNVVKHLLENKALVDLQNNKGWTSLMVVRYNGHTTVVDMLRDNNAIAHEFMDKADLLSKRVIEKMPEKVNDSSTKQHSIYEINDSLIALK